MSWRRPPALPERVLAELQGSDWSIERGKRHWRILIDGRQVAVYGQSGFLRGDHGSSRMMAASIRRFRRQGVQP